MRLLIEINAMGIKDGENKYDASFMLTPYSIAFKKYDGGSNMFEDLNSPENTYNGLSQSEQVRIYEGLKKKLELSLEDYFNSMPVKDKNSENVQREI